MAMDETELARIRADAERVAITRGIYQVAGPFHGEAASQYLQACIGTSLDVDAMALLAEVERLKADRDALLGLWIVEDGGRWLIRNEPMTPLTCSTREKAERAVLDWARSMK